MADIVGKVEKLIDELVTLKVVTQVGERKIETLINLVQGDMTTTMHEDFITGNLQSLREFHATQVAKGETTVMNNLEAIVRVGRQIVQSRNSDAK